MNENGSIRATWVQLYPLGQLLGPSDLGATLFVKMGYKRIGLTKHLVDNML